MPAFTTIEGDRANYTAVNFGFKVFVDASQRSQRATIVNHYFIHIALMHGTMSKYLSPSIESIDPRYLNRLAFSKSLLLTMPVPGSFGSNGRNPALIRFGDNVPRDNHSIFVQVVQLGYETPRKHYLHGAVCSVHDKNKE